MFQPVAALPIDADLWWIVYLRGALVGRTEPYAQGVKFDRVVPATRPDRFVVVRRDGGSVRGVFDRPRITLDVWAKTDQDVANLARLVTALAFDAPGTNGCVRVEHLSGPLDVTEASGQPRRTVLIEATHRTDILAI
jgi:hypothetical protein